MYVCVVCVSVCVPDEKWYLRPEFWSLDLLEPSFFFASHGFPTANTEGVNMDPRCGVLRSVAVTCLAPSTPSPANGTFGSAESCEGVLQPVCSPGGLVPVTGTLPHWQKEKTAESCWTVDPRQTYCVDNVLNG